MMAELWYDWIYKKQRGIMEPYQLMDKLEQYKGVIFDYPGWSYKYYAKPEEIRQRVDDAIQQSHMCGCLISTHDFSCTVIKGKIIL